MNSTKKIVDMLYAKEDKEWFGDDFMELLATTILDATYNKVDLDKVIDDQKHSKKNNEENLRKSSLNSKNYLMEHLECIHT